MTPAPSPKALRLLLLERRGGGFENARDDDDDARAETRFRFLDHACQESALKKERKNTTEKREGFVSDLEHTRSFGSYEATVALQLEVAGASNDRSDLRFVFTRISVLFPVSDLDDGECYEDSHGPCASSELLIVVI